MADVRLLVNGRRYGGWKSVSITRSIETAAGAFTLDVSERWSGQQEPWPIAEEDACRVEIDGQVVIDGYVDRRRPSLTGQTRTLTISGRDKTAALVDCSAVLAQWSFRNASVLDIARKVAASFGIKVSLQPGLTLPKPLPKLAINPGDTAFRVIERAAKAAGVLAVSDGAGGLLLARAGTGRAAPLVEGENILSASTDYNAMRRYRRYIAMTQVAGTDKASGEATRIRAEATDEGVRRIGRVLLVRPESGVTTDYARQRVDWEARVRAAQAEKVTVGVQGWKQPDGVLWPVNALVFVRSPAIGVAGDMLISQVEYSLSEGGELTRLGMVRPDAFTPEPRIAKVKGTGTGMAWKELAGGAR